MKNKFVLDVQHVHKSFVNRSTNLLHWFGRGGATPIFAVEDVSFSLEAGQCLGVVGESGSGKTTLVRMLAGLLAPTTGCVLCHGTPIDMLKASLRGKVQMVFQDPSESLNPSYTVFRTIAEPLRRLRGLRDPAQIDAEVNRISELVGLPTTLLSRYPHQLSGGQKARVGIARALAPEPAVILLDEPTTALDVLVQAKVLLLLDQLRTDLGLSYVFISHDLSVVRLLCDRVMVMKHGKVIERGEVGTLFAQPQTDYTRELLSAVPSTKPPASLKTVPELATG